MNKGGYQIVDLENQNAVKGMPVSNWTWAKWKAVQGTTKPIMFKNIMIEDIHYGDVIVGCAPAGTGFVTTIYGYTVTIDDNHIIFSKK